MSTMNVSLPRTLKAFVDEEARRRGYASSSEYVRELIRRDQERLALRQQLLEGAASPLAETVDGRYFADLRRKIRDRS